MQKNDLITHIARKEHKRWAKWQAYLHSCCIKNSDGSLTIPKEKVERWERQANTDFDNLTPSEQASDIKEAEYILNNIKQFYKGAQPKGIIFAGIWSNWLNLHR